MDTTVWIDFLRGVRTPETAWLDLQLDKQRLGMTDLIFSEVLQGIPDDSTLARVRRALLRFSIFPGGGVELAVAAAENFRILRRRGITVRKTIDCWIATFCLRNNHALLHRDHDFDAFEQWLGLAVVHT